MNGFDNKTRRAFLKGSAAGAALAATAGVAQAQSAITDILAAPGRGSWDDQFDAAGARVSRVANSRTPVLSPRTASAVEQAIARYRLIVANGGWPAVNPGQALRVGVRENSVRELRQRLIVSGDLPAGAGINDTFDTVVDGGLKRFQTRHGMTADGVVGNYTLAALNVSAAVRLGQLETNLMRLRAMPGDLGDRYVMVNIPAAAIEAVGRDRVALRNKAIVGKVDRQTPIMSSKIHELILNPYWTAPKSIIRRDIIPLMRTDPTYLTRNKIRLFDAKGEEVPPQSVDWSTEEAMALRFRQDPGQINAMSSTKVNFYNPHAVYLHDTPQKSMFGRFMRFESSGCVRVHNIHELNLWLLQANPDWTRQRMYDVIASGVATEIALNERPPIYMVYISGWATGDGVVHFRDDIYQRDGADALQLSSTVL